MVVERNPRDSMKSTWRYDRSQWRLPHYILNLLDVYHVNTDEPVPVHAKTDSIPYLTEWSCHAWIIAHAAWPILLQCLFVALTGQNLPPIFAFLLYTSAFKFNAIHQVKIFRRLGHRLGFFDGDKHERDGVPDVGVRKTLHSLFLTTTVRPLFTLMLAYNAREAPSLSWWLPAELALYAIVLDFWFYLYHRACHEVDALWKYHRTHHLTKHPTSMLSAYADSEQEIIEIAIIPLLTYGTMKLLGFPMGFYDWWVCHEYIIFAEAFGHSGLRLYSSPPGAATWLLKYFSCELQLEDHDLHHRKGWRQSNNYGKQTRLWDRIFGTCGQRIESDVANVDFSKKVNMPLF